MTDILKVADDAKMIVNGYAYTPKEGQICVLNLNRPQKAAVLSNDGKIIETTMDDIELEIVKGYFYNNREFLAE
ncbi:MAG: hypothetical protein J6M62_10130 [Selenomonadaceae bacterium]|nr:hypothetical protein [Selenomonadaceae bacterium]